VTQLGRYRSTLLLLNYNGVVQNGPAHRRIAEAMRLMIRTRLT
jgi:hypothetical protein